MEDDRWPRGRKETRRLTDYLDGDDDGDDGDGGDGDGGDDGLTCSNTFS